MPAADPQTWIELARQCASPNALARAKSIYRLWFTAPDAHRLSGEAERRQAADLALQACRLWRSAGRPDLADSEITWTIFYLKGRLSRYAARRYAKRRLNTSPHLPLETAAGIADPDLRWWVSAPRAERLNWRFFAAHQRARCLVWPRFVAPPPSRNKLSAFLLLRFLSAAFARSKRRFYHSPAERR